MRRGILDFYFGNEQIYLGKEHNSMGNMPNKVTKFRSIRANNPVSLYGVLHHLSSCTTLRDITSQIDMWYMIIPRCTISFLHLAYTLSCSYLQGPYFNQIIIPFHIVLSYSKKLK